MTGLTRELSQQLTAWCPQLIWHILVRARWTHRAQAQTLSTQLPTFLKVFKAIIGSSQKGRQWSLVECRCLLPAPRGACQHAQGGP